jgi:hypothetical protein
MIARHTSSPINQPGENIVKSMVKAHRFFSNDVVHNSVGGPKERRRICIEVEYGQGLKLYLVPEFSLVKPLPLSAGGIHNGDFGRGTNRATDVRWILVSVPTESLRELPTKSINLSGNQRRAEPCLRLVFQMFADSTDVGTYSLMKFDQI